MGKNKDTDFLIHHEVGFSADGFGEGNKSLKKVCKVFPIPFFMGGVRV